jgi:CheY-like chemotaxis protein
MTEQLKILLVEDNFEHLKLTKYILKDNNVPGDVFVVRDGQEAIDFLFRKNKFSDSASSPTPSVVLLDLNLPRVDGKEVLRMIKSDRRLKSIPVIVVSSSDREEDVQYASQMGAAAYITKSGGFEQLSKALSSIHTFAFRNK